MDRNRGTFLLLVLAALSTNCFAEPVLRDPARTNHHLVAKVNWSYDFFLCTSDHSGKKQTYSCRDYTENDVSYRLFFRGGSKPKAAARVDGRMPNEIYRHYDISKLQLPVYQVAPPEGLPAGSRFIGSGVCRNEQNEPLPCGVFEHAPARDPYTYRYMVFYHDLGGGPVKIGKYIAGPNDNAIPAEFAYQTGLGLVQSSCCAAEGLAYLAYAHELFPDSREYRQAYERYQAIPDRFAER